MARGVSFNLPQTSETFRSHFQTWALRTMGVRTSPEFCRSILGTQQEIYRLHTGLSSNHQKLSNLTVFPNWHLGRSLLRAWLLFFILRYLYSFSLFKFCVCRMLETSSTCTLCHSVANVLLCFHRAHGLTWTLSIVFTRGLAGRTPVNVCSNWLKHLCSHMEPLRISSGDYNVTLLVWGPTSFNKKWATPQTRHGAASRRLD